jgi:exopolyphosphatase/guanosine-5'-triphosphate,3'-diphosphate pyrophosphatase
MGERTRVAVVDAGTNSTRLLIADVAGDGSVTEIDRRSQVTRLGDGVDRTGDLRRDAMERVFAVMDRYAAAIGSAGCDTSVAILTSAVRDAANGSAFADELSDRFGIEARVITGDTEAELTYRGAVDDFTAPDGRPLLVVDIGGGSTELVVGHGDDVEFHVSTQAGVVRQSERFLATDPPAEQDLERLAGEVRSTFTAAVPEPVRASRPLGIAVAGTPTSCAAVAQELEPYDSTRVHGFRLTRAECERQLKWLGSLPLAERRAVPGLHPDRAPTVVAGVAILIEAMWTFSLDEVVVSEHDLLRGVARTLAASPTRG